MVTMAEWFWTTVGDRFTGTMDADLAAMLTAMQGGRVAPGTMDADLAAMLTAMQGGRVAPGTMDADLAAMLASMSASRTGKATAAATLAAMTASAQGSRTVAGTMAGALGGITASISGEQLENIPPTTTYSDSYVDHTTYRKYTATGVASDTGGSGLTASISYKYQFASKENAGDPWVINPAVTTRAASYTGSGNWSVVIQDVNDGNAFYYQYKWIYEYTVKDNDGNEYVFTKDYLGEPN